MCEGRSHIDLVAKTNLGFKKKNLNLRSNHGELRQYFDLNFYKSLFTCNIISCYFNLGCYYEGFHNYFLQIYISIRWIFRYFKAQHFFHIFLFFIFLFKYTLILSFQKYQLDFWHDSKSIILQMSGIVKNKKNSLAWFSSNELVTSFMLQS